MNGGREGGGGEGTKGGERGRVQYLREIHAKEKGGRENPYRKKGGSDEECELSEKIILLCTVEGSAQWYVRTIFI